MKKEQKEKGNDTQTNNSIKEKHVDPEVVIRHFQKTISKLRQLKLTAFLFPSIIIFLFW